jgi:hypothetical protein
MVWKFNSSAAEAKHTERLQRSALIADAPVLTDVVGFKPAPAATAVQNVEPTLKPGQGQVLKRQVPAQGPLQATRIEPGFTVDSLADAPLPPDPPALIVLDLADFPATELSWDVPPFEGTPDELPDLRPAPPTPLEHPGLQFRSLNTFGHALRLPADDERQQLWLEQRRDRGFDDTELWGLDDAFARFVLPRLKALRQQKLEAPSKRMELTLWYSLLDKMIRAFELLLPEGGGAWSRGTLNDRERAQVQEGLDLFRQYYFSLAW